MIRIKITNNPNKEWDDFVSTYTGTIFYTSQWAKIIKEGFGTKLYYFIMYEDNKIVLVLPGIIIKKMFFKMFYSSVVYGGFIGEKKYVAQLLDFVEKKLKNDGIHKINIDLGIQSDLKIFQSKKYFKKNSYRHLVKIDNNNYNYLWRNFKQIARRHIRIAKKNGIEIRVIKNRDEISLFYKLYLASMQRNKSAVKYPQKYIELIFDLLIKTKKAEITFAYYKNKPIATVLTIFSKDCVHYLFNGFDYQYRKFCPNDLIIDYLLKNAVDKNKKYFDFMNSSKDDFELMRFKNKWGSEKKEFITYQKNISNFMCLLWDLAMFFANTKIGFKLSKLLQNIWIK